jgi:hypothetical protein
MHVSRGWFWSSLLKRGAWIVGISDQFVPQFDHREGKAKDVGWLVSSGSRPGLIAQELEKCDVRCANCHRRRTAHVGNWYRVQYLLGGEQTLPKSA